MEETQHQVSHGSARDRILDAAEAVFADDGFSGAGMKAIATKAGVAQGLLHYHFNNKEGLYAAVIERRSGIINGDRLERLEQVNLSAQDAVSQILHALMIPPLGPKGGGRAYARILAGLTVGDARDAELVRLHYDDTASKFIDALQTALPEAPRSAISWGYNFAIGTLVTAVSNSGRPERLGGVNPQDTQHAEVLSTLTTYVEGGMRALISQETKH